MLQGDDPILEGMGAFSRDAPSEYTNSTGSILPIMAYSSGADVGSVSLLCHGGQFGPVLVSPVASTVAMWWGETVRFLV